MSKRNRMSSNHSTRNFLIVLAVMMGGIFLCVGSIIFGSFWMTAIRGPGGDSSVSEQASPLWPADSAELTVAVSPVMAPVLAQLADQFNAENHKTPDGKTMSVRTVVYEPEKMVSAALGRPEFQAMSPDSSLWLDRLETAWSGRAAEQATAQPPTGSARIRKTSRRRRPGRRSPSASAAWRSRPAMPSARS